MSKRDVTPNSRVVSIINEKIQSQEDSHDPTGDLEHWISEKEENINIRIYFWAPDLHWSKKLRKVYDGQEISIDVLYQVYQIGLAAEGLKSICGGLNFIFSDISYRDLLGSKPPGFLIYPVTLIFWNRSVPKLCKSYILPTYFVAGSISRFTIYFCNSNIYIMYVLSDVLMYLFDFLSTQLMIELLTPNIMNVP